MCCQLCLEVIAQIELEALIGALVADMEIVIHAEDEGTLAHFETGLAAVGDTVEVLGIESGGEVRSGEAHIVVEHAVTGGGHHFEVRRRLDVPALIRGELLAEAQAHGEADGGLMQEIAFHGGIDIGRITLVGDAAQQLLTGFPAFEEIGTDLPVLGDVIQSFDKGRIEVGHGGRGTALTHLDLDNTRHGDVILLIFYKKDKILFH